MRAEYQCPCCKRWIGNHDMTEGHVVNAHSYLMYLILGPLYDFREIPDEQPYGLPDADDD